MQASFAIAEIDKNHAAVFLRDVGQPAVYILLPDKYVIVIGDGLFEVRQSLIHGFVHPNFDKKCSFAIAVLAPGLRQPCQACDQE